MPYRHGGDPLLDEVTSRMVKSKAGSSSSHAGQPYLSDPAVGTPSDIDLMQTMISRIAILEKHIQIQTKQIQDKVEL